MVNLLKYLVLPPVMQILLILMGLLLLHRYRRLGLLCLWLAVGSLLLLSLPLVSYQLQRGLEIYPPVTRAQMQQAEVIVVLGGGREYSGSEFGWSDAPSEKTISRLSYAAFLQRQTGLPLLLTGGRVHGEAQSEAELMQQLLQASFGIRAVWLEEQSRTTHENARYTAELLQQTGISRILLVSQGWHLARAVPVFEAQGFVVIPAPIQFASPPPAGLIRWIPRSYYLDRSTQALHEWMGRLVYALYRS